MHPEAWKFLTTMKNQNPELFKNKKVLDVGGGDINGNNKSLFENCEYHCNDIYKTHNVTIVEFTKNLPFDDETFDIIISTECFEHDQQYEESIRKIVKMLKNDGVFIFTCASLDRKEHGTRRTTPNDSYTSRIGLLGFQDYYKNLFDDDITKIEIENGYIFSDYFIYDFFYNHKSNDLYFIGIKNNINYTCKEGQRPSITYNFDYDLPSSRYLPDHNLVI